MEEQNQVKDDQVEKVQEKNFTLPEPEDMVDIGVEFNLKTNMVILKVGLKKIGFTIEGARNLALALRQSANMVEKHAN